MNHSPGADALIVADLLHPNASFFVTTLCNNFQNVKNEDLK